jgi:hypothetical protein
MDAPISTTLQVAVDALAHRAGIPTPRLYYDAALAPQTV